MKLKIEKLHPDAIIPAYATPGAACFDLHTIGAAGVPYQDSDRYILAAGEQRIFRTGLAIEVPLNWRMDIHSRSGHGFKNGVRLANGTGKIDSDYRGEIMVCLRNDGKHDVIISKFDRIAQAELNPVVRVSFELVGELSGTERGAGGFGSTGN